MGRIAVHHVVSLARLCASLALVSIVAIGLGLGQHSRPIAFSSGEMVIASSAFEDGGEMPAKYTCSGDDVSPPLEFHSVPEAADTLALVMEDADAPGGTFLHWIVWNIPARTVALDEGEEPEGVGGKNDFGRMGYDGPCPPSGVQRYYFTLCAIDGTLELSDDPTVEDLREAMTGRILSEAVLMAEYGRERSPALLVAASLLLVAFAAAITFTVLRRRGAGAEAGS